MTQQTPIPDDIRKEASRWFAAREADALDAVGEEGFHIWLAADARHREAFARAEAVWAALGDLPTTASAWVPAAQQFRRRARSGRPWRIPVAGRRSALCGAVAASIAVAVVFAADLPMRWRADAMTAVGEQRSVTLPDGSAVQLDTNSAVAIESGDGRHIALLRGEAAFTVARGDRPFVVRASGGSVTALGTRFVVRRDGTDIRAAVTEHSVRVEQGGAARVVAQGWQVRYGAAGIGRPERIDIVAADAWTRGRLRVVNRPLGEVVAELARYHSGYFAVAGAGLADLPVSGVFDLHNPVAAIGIIEQTLRLGSTRLTDRIIILHRPENMFGSGFPNPALPRLDIEGQSQHSPIMAHCGE